MSNKNKTVVVTAPVKPASSVRPCPHAYIPVEYVGGIRVNAQTTNLLVFGKAQLHSCTHLRVSKLYCPLCKTFLDLPYSENVDE